MKRQLSSLLSTSLVVLSIAFVGTASADPFSLTASCSLPTYVADKCALTIRLVDSATNGTTKLKSLILKANGKEVLRGTNDSKTQVDSTFFSNTYNIQATCARKYTVTAVLSPTATVGTSTVTCPAKVAL
jgi:hypothetical protein